MILIGDWHTEDIDSEHLSFSVFSIVTRSKNSCINNRYIVFISRWKKLTDKGPKEYEQSCKEQSYLNELLQIMYLANSVFMQNKSMGMLLIYQLLLMKTFLIIRSILTQF